MKDLTVYMQRLTFPQEAMESVKARWTPELEVLAHRYMEGEISLKEALASLEKKSGSSIYAFYWPLCRSSKRDTKKQAWKKSCFGIP